MALSKEVVLDRLKYIAASGGVPKTPYSEFSQEAAESAIALINSTDVAEAEKLRARVLELEAERDCPEQESVEKKYLASEVEKLHTRVLELEAERDGLLQRLPDTEKGPTAGRIVGYMSRRTSDGRLRWFWTKPSWDAKRRYWWNPAGDCLCEFVNDASVQALDLCPVYLGQAEWPE